MIVFDLPENEYHSHPALSASGAKLLLDSPARYKHTVIDGNRRESKAFDVGSAVHALVLGTGWDVEELEFDSFRTKAAQQARDEVRADGRIPMLAKELEPVRAIADSVLSHPSARKLFEQEGRSEVSVFAEDNAIGIPVRARFDFLPDHREYGVDLKTTGKKASVRGFASAAASYGYDVQEAHYGHTYAMSEGTDPIPMVFAVVETEPPYLVGVYQLDHDFAHMGREKAAIARARYARGIRNGEWPGYPTAITQTPPPVWSINDHIDLSNEEHEYV